MSTQSVHEVLSQDSEEETPMKQRAKVLRLPPRNRPENAPRRGARLLGTLLVPFAKARSLLQYPGKLLSLIRGNQPPIRGRSARELIIAAMAARAELRIRYEGHFGYLDVEPHALYRDASNFLTLLCYEIPHPEENEAGEGWHRLKVADMVAAFPSGRNFIAKPWPPELAPLELLHQVEIAEVVPNQSL